PYVAYVDSVADARSGFAPDKPQRLAVRWQPDAWAAAEKNSKEFRAMVEDILAYDPRPAYQDEPGRVYGVRLGDVNVRFRVGKDEIEIVDINDCSAPDSHARRIHSAPPRARKIKSSARFHSVLSGDSRWRRWRWLPALPVCR